MLNRHLHVLLLTALIFLAGCKSNTEVSTGEVDQTAQDSTAQDTAIGPKQTPAMKAAREDLAALTEEWNNAQTMLHIADLPKYYADEVMYYGSMISRDQVVEVKKEALRENPDVKSTAIVNASVEVFSETSAKVNFQRSVETKKGTRITTGYIQFRKEGDGWKITIESDIEADAKRVQTASKPISAGEINSCDKAAEAIFRSAQVVQGMLRAPGSTYKVEYKPGDPDNPYKNRYVYWVFMQAMGVDHVDTMGRFLVDPATGDLYQYDAVQDKSTKIPADNSLQKYIKKYCGK
jgi:hypothetical protein